VSAQTYIIDLALIALVLVQIRARPLSPRFVLMPLILLIWAVSSYYKHATFNSHDVLLVVVFGLVGVALGVVSGSFTKVWAKEGRILVQAGVVAATAWVLGMGFRFFFALWSTSGAGGRIITSFSISNNITSEQIWVDALLLMAICQVAVRVGVVQWRAQKLRQDPTLHIAPTSRRSRLLS